MPAPYRTCWSLRKDFTLCISKTILYFTFCYKIMKSFCSWYFFNGTTSPFKYKIVEKNSGKNIIRKKVLSLQNIDWSLLVGMFLHAVQIWNIIWLMEIMCVLYHTAVLVLLRWTSLWHWFFIAKGLCYINFILENLISGLGERACCSSFGWLNEGRGWRSS